jgi:hypothetical protein
MSRTQLLSPLFAALLAFSAGAQEARCLLAEGSPLPGVPGHTVGSINNTAANQLGGWACTVNSSDGVTTLSHVWGTATGGAGAVGGPLQSEATIGMYDQTSFESFFGFDDAGVASYSPLCNDTVSGATGLDAVWLGNAVVAIEDDPIPSLSGKVWRFGSRPNVTRDGVPVWAGGIDDAVTGTNEGEGLFMGLGATVIYKTGDTPLGAPAAIDAGGIDFDYAFSAYGNHHLTGVEMGLASTEDYLVVMDGAALFIGGLIVQEGHPIPAGAGGLVGELWGSFDFYGINESGDYFFTGDTGGATATDEFVLKNGMIVYREGDVVDGRTLTGSIDGAAMNANGEVAYVWDVEDPGGALEALFFEDQLVLLEGDNVDVTGDGVPDPGATISDFTGIAAVTLGPNRAIYLTADVDVLGTTSTSDDVECFFAATPAGVPDFVASPYELSTALGGDQSMFVDAGPAAAGAVYLVAGSISGTSPGIPFGAFTIPLNPDFYLTLTLNKPGVPPLADTLGILDAGGTALAQWKLPAGTLPFLAGITASHAAVVLDPFTFAVLYVSVPTSLTFVP